MMPKSWQPYTTPEILYLFARLMPRHVLSVAFIIQWSRWRRQHQFQAAIAHRKMRT